MNDNKEKNTKKWLLTTLKIALCISGTYMSLNFNERAMPYFISFFAGSGSFFTKSVSGEPTPKIFALICVIAAFVAVMLIVILFKAKFLERLYARLSQKSLLARIMLVMYAFLCAQRYVTYYNHHELRNYDYYMNIIEVGVGVGWFDFLPPFVATIIMWIPLTLLYLFFIMILVDFLYDIIKSFDRFERIFFLSGSGLGFAFIAYAYNQTSIYYGWIDRVYSYDAYPSMHYLLNPFFIWSYSNYTLQPSFTMPVLLPSVWFELYSPLWRIITSVGIQFALLMVVFVLISRMISQTPKIRRLSLLIFAFSFPTVIIATVVERRVMALTFLIFAIYQALYKKHHSHERNLWYAVAGGSIICNMYVFLMSIRSKSTALRDLAVSGTIFLFLTAFLGKIGGLVDIKSQVERFESSGWLDTKMSMGVKAIHYMYLISSTLFAPPSAPNETGYWWQLPPTTGVYFWLGVIIFALAMFGFIANYKSAYARIAFVSVLVSIFFVFYQALNISENAVVLNTLFYAWAFVSLLIMGLDKLINRERIKTILLTAVAGVCLVWNVTTAVQILRFGMEHFPTKI
ncbi:MAG: hypothetical protein FWG45_02215 [Oscillospiraceae bacterium]|nr:hypothetical protein [Oscillospiraceae bacterium]